MTRVHPAIQHFVLLLFAATSSAVGWFMAHNPSKVHRFFTFGIMPVREKGFFIRFFKVTGWCFAIFFAAGTLEYSFLIVSDLLR
jgi:hypothetical protein